MPFTVNKFYWSETIMGVTLSGTYNSIDYELAWLRPMRDAASDDDDNVEDMDAFYGRITFKAAAGTRTGLFAVYHTGDGDNGGGPFATITSQNYELKKLAP
ncbi:MAG: hypothetical protein JXO49_00015 [Deltaproteobacteria bacterium]|nr:hypothetical protein [Candidatus Anaeroferrophillus wilburensis]MBN2887708.1 hypothetical protein [Deltaproteobacteria bacterium]